MIRNLLNRIQLILVSLLLFGAFGFLFAVVLRYNHRWDTTPEKIYSLSQTAKELLSKMGDEKIEVAAFYPSNETEREDFEMLLKACQMQHFNFQYSFYNPNRQPQLAKAWRVKELYTVIIRFRQKQERLVLPDEESFAQALLRLLSPREIPICFLKESGDERMDSDAVEGFRLLRETLVDYNYPVQILTLGQLEIPSICQVVVVAGPQSDWKTEEVDLLRRGFAAGKSILFLIDPMDLGTGKTFEDFMKDHGIQLWADVIVDKMSRVMGGDFLLPFVNQYAAEHPLTVRFETATFFPVARSIHPLVKNDAAIEVVPLAFSGSNSWAETNLTELEKGEAAFESETDFPGPVPLVAAVQEKIDPARDTDRQKGQEETVHLSSRRMVVVGDSDFLTNAYIRLSGNQDFMFRMLRWLSRDERIVDFEPHSPTFQPLFLGGSQRLMLLVMSLLGYPLFFLIIGFAQNLWRRNTA